MSKMILERSSDTQAVIDVLRGVNDEIAYEQIGKRTGLTMERVKQVLPSARRILDNELIGFGVIYGVGLKRLAPRDKATLTTVVLERIGRASSRGLKRTTIDDADYNAMDKSAQHLHAANRTIINLMRKQVMARERARLANSDQTKPEAPPLPNIGNLIGLGTKKGS